MRGSFAAPLPIFRQIFLRVVDSHRAIRDDVAGFIQRQLPLEQLRGRGTSHADEHAVAGKVMFRAGVDIF